jgi:hypothetical protein
MRKSASRILTLGCILGVVWFGAPLQSASAVGPSSGAKSTAVRHKATRRHGSSGPVCPTWGISFACVCPKKVTREATGAPPDLPSNDGWVEIRLTYPRFLPVTMCPGGIAIENTVGGVVASKGYSSTAHTGLGERLNGAHGVASGSISTFALPVGTWTALSDDRRGVGSTVSFQIVAGRPTRLNIALSD